MKYPSSPQMPNYALDLYEPYPVLSIEKTGEIGIACPGGDMRPYEEILDNYIINNIYSDLKRIARGEKPYRTEDNLSVDGMKLNGKAEIWFEGPLRFYDITIDNDVEKMVSSLVHTYVHERIHPEYWFEDSDAAVEYLTGRALYRLMHADDEEVSALAKKGYESFISRQISLKNAVFGDFSEDLYKNYCETAIKKLYSEV